MKVKVFFLCLVRSKRLLHHQSGSEEETDHNDSMEPQDVGKICWSCRCKSRNRLRADMTPLKNEGQHEFMFVQFWRSNMDLEATTIASLWTASLRNVKDLNGCSWRTSGQRFIDSSRGKKKPQAEEPLLCLLLFPKWRMWPNFQILKVPLWLFFYLKKCSH